MNLRSAPYLGRDHAVPGFERVASGKVRDIYRLDDEHLLFVASDRISAFDVVMAEGVPHKGRILTAIATYWFRETADLIENHLVSSRVEDVAGLDAEWRAILGGRVMIVRRAAPTSVEWVVRGYLAGSGWKEYQKQQSVCGVPLPSGLALSSRLPEPILTPTTKDEHHDLPLTPAQARERVGAETFDAAEAAALALFARGSAVLERAGVILADTKFEFGHVGGRLALIDEALTPDSSRFWPADQWRPGANPPSYDKQILRDYLETLDWNKEYPPPRLDPAVLARVQAKYLEVCRLITGTQPAEVLA